MECMEFLPALESFYIFFKIILSTLLRSILLQKKRFCKILLIASVEKLKERDITLLNLLKLKRLIKELSRDKPDLNPILINLKRDYVLRIDRLGGFYITLKCNIKILNLTDKGLAGFTKKLNLWKNSIDNGDYSRFSALHEFPEDTNLEVEDNENSVLVPISFQTDSL